MEMFFVWARPVDALPGVDHTWVTTYNPVEICPPSRKAYWYCWGDCHTTTEGSGAVLVRQGEGDIERASLQCKPNDPDDHAGLTGFYGQHGVCHQIANRILSAGKTGMDVKGVKGAFMSYLIYGLYGSDGTFDD